ncbi:MAG: hypothetical protein LBC38_03110 [Oscillospiraceae bacterium]|jgi:chromosome segregation ATPase|nr:hypothetical protein [Oscillospiraceae bacterium]
MQYKVNGAVQSPIILRGYTEQSIAQQVHDMIWRPYMHKATSNDAEWMRLKQSGEPTAEFERQSKEFLAKVQKEIDQAVIKEITEYRESKGSLRGTELETRIDELEARIDELQGLIENATGLAEEVNGRVDELESRISALE